MIKTIKWLDNVLIKLIGKENLILLQFIIGFLGISYGIVAFFYYYLKISTLYSFIFLIPIIIGIWLISNGRSEIINGNVRTKVNPF